MPRRGAAIPLLRRYRFLLLALVSATWSVGSPGFAQEAFDHGELDLLEDYEDYSEEEFKSGYDLLQPLTDGVQPYFDWKQRIREAWGLSYIVENGLIFQASPNKGGELTDRSAQPELLGRRSSWSSSSSTIGFASASESSPPGPS